MILIMLLLILIFLLPRHAHCNPTSWPCDRSRNHGSFFVLSDGSCTFAGTAADEQGGDNANRFFGEVLKNDRPGWPKGTARALYEVGNGNPNTLDKFPNVGALELSGNSPEDRGIIAMDTASWDIVFPDFGNLRQGIALIALLDGDDRLVLNNLNIQAYTRTQIWSHNSQPYLRFADVRGAGTFEANNVTFKGWTNAVVSVAKGSNSFFAECSFFYNKRGVDTLDHRGSVIYGGNDQFQISKSANYTRVKIIKSTFVENMHTSIHTAGINARIVIEDSSFHGASLRPTGASTNLCPYGAININDWLWSDGVSMHPDHLQVRNSNFSYYYGHHKGHHGVIASPRGNGASITIEGCQFHHNSQLSQQSIDAAVIMFGNIVSKRVVGGVLLVKDTLFEENGANEKSTSCILLHTTGLMPTNFTLLNSIFRRNGRSINPFPSGSTFEGLLASAVYINQKKDSPQGKIQAKIRGCTFDANQGHTNKARALVIEGPASVEISKTTFDGNVGGALLAVLPLSIYPSTWSLEVRGSTFVDNTGDYCGGALCVDGAGATKAKYALRLIGNIFQGNQAKSGGALYMVYTEESNVVMEGNVMDGNKCEGIAHKRGRDIYFKYLERTNFKFTDDIWSKCTKDTSSPCKNNADCSTHERPGRCQGVCSAESAPNGVVDKRCQAGTEVSANDQCNEWRRMISPGLAAQCGTNGYPCTGKCEQKYCCSESRNNIVMRDSTVTENTAGRCGGNPNDSQDICWTASVFNEIVAKPGGAWGLLESNNDASMPRTCPENGCGTVEETGASGCSEREDGVHGHGVVCGGCQWVASAECYVCNPNLKLEFVDAPDDVVSATVATFKLRLVSPSRFTKATCRFAFQYTADDTDDSGATWTNNSDGDEKSVLELRDLQEGVHTLSVRALDPTMLVHSSWLVPVTKHTWKVDLTPPVASLTTVVGSLFALSAPYTNDLTITMELGSNEPGSGLAWEVDNGEGWSCPPNVKCSTAAIQIDETTKSLPLDVNQPGAATASVFGVTAGQADRITKCTCLIGVASAIIRESFRIGAVEGKHVLKVTATDYASIAGQGNIQVQPTEFIWYYDATPPVTSFHSVHLAGSKNVRSCGSGGRGMMNISKSGNIRLVFAASQSCSFFDKTEYCSPLSHFVWDHVWEAFTPSSNMESPNGVVELTNLTHGEHKIIARATDAAGNIGNAVSFSWRVDQRPPIGKLHKFPHQVQRTNAGPLAVGFTMACWDDSETMQESGCDFQYALVPQFQVEDKTQGPTMEQLNRIWSQRVGGNDADDDDDTHAVVLSVPQEGTWWVAVRAIDFANNVQTNTNRILEIMMRVEIVRNGAYIALIVLNDNKLLNPVSEGKSISYEMRLSQPVSKGTIVEVNITTATEKHCSVSSQEQVTFRGTDTATTINLELMDNNVDEGSFGNATCKTNHEISFSSDTNFTAGSTWFSYVTVLNDDVAGVVLLQEMKGINDNVRLLKVMSRVVLEGGESVIPMRLTSEPTQDVIVRMKRTGRATSLPGMPTINVDDRKKNDNNEWLFTSNNWKIPQNISIQVLQDNVDNDLDEEQVELRWMTDTKDEQYAQVEDVVILLSVPDDDSAGFIHVDDASYVSLQEGASNMTESRFRLRSVPTSVVKFSVVTDDSNVVATLLTKDQSVDPKDFKELLTHDFSVHLRALNGARASSTLTLTATSVDPRYNEKTFTTSVAVTPIAVVLPRPKDVKVSLPPTNEHHGRSIVVSWTKPLTATDATTDATTDASSFVVEWSSRRQFDVDALIDSVGVLDTLVSTTSVVVVHTRFPLEHQVVYARVRSKGGETFSDPSIDTWFVTETCKDSSEYLDNTDRSSFASWRCESCPKGAFCEEESIATQRLPPGIGYWHVPWSNLTSVVGHYEKCPNPNNCLGVASKAPNSSSFNLTARTTTCTHGVLPSSVVCGVCDEGFTKTGGPNGICTSCEAGNMIHHIVVLILIVVAMITFCCCVRCNRKQIRKYQSAFGDAKKLFNIIVSLMQVNSSLSNVSPHVQWPQSLTSFYDSFEILNFEVTSVVGGACVSPLLESFAIRYIALCALPAIIVLLTGLRLMVKRKESLGALLDDNNSTGSNVAVAEEIFDAFDEDHSGDIDSLELTSLLQDLGIQTTKEDCHIAISTLEGNRETMRRHTFVTALITGKLPGVDVAAVQRLSVTTKRKKATSVLLSSSLQLLALLHTPVSRATFSYFQCHEVVGRKYMRTDYTIECWTSEKWLLFLPVVLTVLLGFTLLMPAGIGIYLFSRRHRLYTVSVQQKIGFLYKGFTKHAEFWLVHEMMRKLLLTGFLVLVPEVLKTPMGILVSLMALINLNYFKPHRSELVFRAAQASFIITALTYCMSSVFVAAEEQRDGDDRSAEMVAIFLVSLNTLFLVLTVGSAVMVVVVLKRKVDVIHDGEKKGKETDEKVKGGNTKVVPFESAGGVGSDRDKGYKSWGKNEE